jgi:hypothetical protein
MSIGRRRTKQIVVRVTSSEHEQLMKNAQTSQVDLSRYLREAGLIQPRVTQLRLLQQQAQQLSICLHRIYQYHQCLTASGFEIETEFDQVLTIAHRIEQEVNLLSSEDDCQHDCYR